MKFKSVYVKAVLSMQILFAAVLFGVGASAVATEIADITKSQHEELATAYENEAKELEGRVARHERMGKMYETMHAGHKHGLGIGKEALKHCQELTENYRDAAANAAELAKMHHMLGQSANP